MEKNAVISSCGKYRYQLSRIWDGNKHKILFIMLNPSTADAENDDPTIRRCVNFAKDWGYGGIYVGNLFAYRSTDPIELKKISDPIGQKNNLNILKMSLNSHIIICAWGNNAFDKGYYSLDGLQKGKLYCLGLSKIGRPKHPLYLKSNLMPIKFMGVHASILSKKHGK